MPLAPRYKAKSSTKTDIAARLLSDLMNPLIIPSIVLGIIGYVGHLTYIKLSMLLGITTLFFAIIPMGVAFIIVLRKPDQSVDFPERSSRNILYLSSISSAFVGSVLILHLFPVFYIELTVSIFFINLLAAFILNFKWKISIHAAAVSTGGQCIILLCYFLNATSLSLSLIGLFTLCILLPIVGWARYRLNIHTIPEIAGGIALGFLLPPFTAIVFLF